MVDNADASKTEDRNNGLFLLLSKLLKAATHFLWIYSC